jgi:hypothetical protein
MSEPKSSKNLDQLQLEGDSSPPMPEVQAGRNIVQNPLRVSVEIEHSADNSVTTRRK